MQRVVVIGGGFVGATTATALARRGHAVRLVESDLAHLGALQAGRLPFWEPGLPEAFSAALRSGRMETAGTPGDETPDCVFLCVGTPPRGDGSCDTSLVAAAAQDVSAAGWAPGFTVIVKSTVPPGTTRGVVLPALSGLGAPGEAFGLAMNPEFLREGSALADAEAPDRVVYGCVDSLAASCLGQLYADESCPVVVTDPETAELSKYAANALLATKVSFVNELSRLAERIGVDVDEVAHVVGLDHRIGPHFLQAGPGYGGSCFPKDVAALRSVAREHGIEAFVLDAVEAVNESQPEHVVDLAEAAAGGLSGKVVAVLGLAFKAGTSDVRGTRALPIVRGLRTHGATVRCHDPQAGAEFKRLLPDADVVPDAVDALHGAHLAVLHTDWPAYRDLFDAEAAAAMADAVVLDTRRLLDPNALRAAGFQAHAIGVGRPGSGARAAEPEVRA